jgi:ElaB/YqjD/DUF883 family membrane-anchored ribosome-binding protein
MSTLPSNESHSPGALLDTAAARIEPALREAGRTSTDRIDEWTHAAKDLARGSVQALQHSAVSARDSTAHYIQERPVKSMLIAAGAGAALVLLAGLLLRAVGRSHCT